MRSVRAWLVALTLVAVGCGGRSSGDDVERDDAGAIDARRDGYAADGAAPRDGDGLRTDGATDARDVTAPDIASDRRADSASDARDPGFSDARVDSSDASADGRSDGSDGGVDINDGGTDLSVDSDGPSGNDADGGGDETRTDDVFNDVPTDAPSDVDAQGDGCSGVACGLVALNVAPSSPSLSPHSTYWMQAIGTYDDSSTHDVTKDVHWTRSSAAVLHVSNAAGTEGLVTARSTGNATVTATLGALSSSATVTVLTADPAILRLTPPAPEIPNGTQLPLQATVIFSDYASWADWSTMVQWSSSNTSIATIATDGTLTAVGPGLTTITATVFSLTATATVTVVGLGLTSVTIEPPAPTVPIGPVQHFQAFAHFPDGSAWDVTELATWSSSNAASAAVGDASGTKGRASGVSAGTATISAQYGALSATASMTVSTGVLQSIAVLMPPSQRLMVFMPLPMIARGNYSDGTDFDITDQTTWSSSDSSIVEVSGRTITGIEEGTANVDAVAFGVSQRLPLEVRAGALESIAVTPNPASVIGGQSTHFYATGTYTGGSTYELTWFVPWNTTDPAVAWIGNPGGGAPPKLTGGHFGTTNVTVYWSGIVGTSAVDVTAMAAKLRR